jgi:hypothetical protein
MTTRRGLLVCAIVVMVAGLPGLGAAEAPTGEAPEGRAQLTGTSVARIDAGVEVRVLDDTVSNVQLEVFDAATDAMVWTSGRVSGSAVVWSTDAEQKGRYRFSIKGWDRQGGLVTHQVTTKGLSDIAAIDFSQFPAGTSIEGGSSDITLDGDVIVNGAGPDSMVVVSGAGSGAALRIDADSLTGGNEDALEIEMGSDGPDTTQAIEVQRGESSITAQVRADGSAWFQDSDKPLPAFLPIAFGVIADSGAVVSGSGNFSCTWNAASERYEITITGYSYDISDFVTVATPVSTGVFRSIISSTVSGDLLIRPKDVNGNTVQERFHFVTYASPVTEAHDRVIDDPDEVP